VTNLRACITVLRLVQFDHTLDILLVNGFRIVRLVITQYVFINFFSLLTCGSSLFCLAKCSISDELTSLGTLKLIHTVVIK
jgi:hypothetical protein